MSHEFKINIDGLFMDSELVLKWVDPYDIATVNRVRAELSELIDSDANYLGDLEDRISGLEDELDDVKSDFERYSRRR